MFRIFLLKTRTFIIVLLASNIAAPSYAIPVQTDLLQRRGEARSIHWLLVRDLKNKGLDTDVAERKVSHLFSKNPDGIEYKLTRLESHPDLRLQSSDIMNALTKRALVDRKIDMNNYHSLTALVHDVKGHALSDAERKAILEIALKPI